MSTIVNKMRRPLRKKPEVQAVKTQEYKHSNSPALEKLPKESTLPQSQSPLTINPQSPNTLYPTPKSSFQLFLLCPQQSLRKQYHQQIPYFWVHSKLTKSRKYELYYNELKQHLQTDAIYQLPYIDNLLQKIDTTINSSIESINNGFKVICQVEHLNRLLEFHQNNDELLGIYIFDDQQLGGGGGYGVKRRLNKIKKIKLIESDFSLFKKKLLRNKLEDSGMGLFLNAIRISNWDISEVNKSRLVLKTLLMHQNSEKAKSDFIKLASIMVKDHIDEVYEYEERYQIDKVTPSEAIKWYSKQCFYHKLINNTLKAGKGNPLLLSYIRYPVKELYQAIRNYYMRNKLCKNMFCCYRGGKISEAEIEYFRENVTGFIQMQGFLSCTKNQTEAQQFIVNCLFKITVNNLERQSEWDHGFCELNSSELTDFIKEEEVLFNIFSVMQIKSVTEESILIKDADSHNKGHGMSSQNSNRKKIVIIELEYGSLATQLYKKRHNLSISKHEQKCIKNYEALKPYYNEIKNQGDCFRFFHKFNYAEEYFMNYLNHLMKSSPASQLELFSCYNNLGNICYNLSKYQQSIKFYEKAKQLISGLKVSPIKIASIYNGLGIVYKTCKNPKRAKECYQQTIAILNSHSNGDRNHRNSSSSNNTSSSPHSPSVESSSLTKYLATAYNNLASLIHQELDDDASHSLPGDRAYTPSRQKQPHDSSSVALQYYLKALNLLENQPKSQTQNDTIANILFNIGVLNLSKGQYNESQQYLLRSLEIYVIIFGTHKQTSNVHLKLGQLYLLKGKKSFKSNEHFQQCLAMTKQLYGPFSQSAINVKRHIEQLKSKKQNENNFAKRKDINILGDQKNINQYLNGDGHHYENELKNQQLLRHSENRAHVKTSLDAAGLNDMLGELGKGGKLSEILRNNGSGLSVSSNNKGREKTISYTQKEEHEEYIGKKGGREIKNNYAQGGGSTMTSSPYQLNSQQRYGQKSSFFQQPSPLLGMGTNHHQKISSTQIRAEKSQEQQKMRQFRVQNVLNNDLLSMVSQQEQKKSISAHTPMPSNSKQSSLATVIPKTGFDQTIQEEINKFDMNDYLNRLSEKKRQKKVIRM